MSVSDAADDLAVLASRRGRWVLFHPVPGWQDWVVVVRPKGATRSSESVVLEHELLAGAIAKAAEWFVKHG